MHYDTQKDALHSAWYWAMRGMSRGTNESACPSLRPYGPITDDMFIIYINPDSGLDTDQNDVEQFFVVAGPTGIVVFHFGIGLGYHIIPGWTDLPLLSQRQKVYCLWNEILHSLDSNTTGLYRIPHHLRLQNTIELVAKIATWLKIVALY